MYSKKFGIFIEMWRQDFAMEKSIDEKKCQDGNGRPIPWYTYPAIEYLQSFNYDGKRIFEYGCGWSSMFWAERAAEVTAVEDKRQWFAKWQRDLQAPRLDVRLRTADENYEKTIFEDGRRYDVIVIDGIRRKFCAEAAVAALSDDGMIILDDSDRATVSADYAAAIDILRRAGLLQVDFYGCSPMVCYTKTTSLFLRRNFDFKPAGKIQPTNGWGNLWHRPRKQRKEFYKKVLS